MDMADGYFLVYFSTEEDYSFALFEGPWMIADHYVIVQRWRPMFLQNAESVKNVAVWIRIPRLPLELFNTHFVWRIGSGLGSMMKVDRLTSIHSRGQYARICVEIDLEKPLKTFIIIRGYKLFLEYEGLHLICFHCGRYRISELSKGPKSYISPIMDILVVAVQPPSVQAPAAQIPNPSTSSSPVYGARMIASSRRPKKNQKNQRNQKDSGSRKKNINADSSGKKVEIDEEAGGSRFALLLKISFFFHSQRRILSILSRFLRMDCKYLIP